MSLESAPQVNSDWDGLHGARQTGDYKVEPYSPNASRDWIKYLGLPPRKAEETWQEWAIRIRNEAPQGEENGTE